MCRVRYWCNKCGKVFFVENNVPNRIDPCNCSYIIDDDTTKCLECEDESK